MKQILMAVVIIFLAVTGASAFSIGKDKFEAEVEKEEGAVKLVREVMRGGYDVVTTSELHEILASGEDVVVIDTMPYEDSYLKNHIPGAKQFLFPIPEMSEWKDSDTDGKSQQDFLALLGADKAKKIVFYCGFVKCTRSHNGAMWATKLGYTNVSRHPGGIFAWKGAGYEVQEGK